MGRVARLIKQVKLQEDILVVFSKDRAKWWCSEDRWRLGQPSKAG